MKRLFTLLGLLLFVFYDTNALTAYSVASGNWNNSSTWLLGIKPGAGDDAVIANNNTVTVTANASCASLTIGNGLLSAATALTVSSGITLTVSGSINIVAPLLGTTDNSLNVNDGTVNCASLSTSNSLSDSKRCVVNINNGTLSCSGSFAMANNTTRNKLIFSNSGLLQIGGNASTILDAQFTASTGTVEYNSSSGQNIIVLSYSTLKCSGSGTKLLASNLQTHSLIVNPGATLNIAVGNSLSVSESFTNNSNIIGAGTVVLNGSAAQTIDGNGTMTNLRLNNSNGATILNNSGNMVNITGRYTPTSGVLTTNDKLTLKSDASGTAVIAAGSSSGNYITGKAILERYVPGRRAWRLFTFPITSTGAPTINNALQEGAGGNASLNPNPGYGTHITGGSVANGFDQNSINNPSFKEFVSGSWQGVTTTNQSIANQSMYLMFVRGSRANNLGMLTGAPIDNTTLRVTGNVKQGDQTISVSGTGWQPIPNPFPSVLSLYNLAVANSTLMNNNYSFWDPKMGGTNNVGAFVTASYDGSSYDLVPTPTSSLSEYAQPFSVFFIDAIATGTLSIPESGKCNCGNDNVFRPASDVQSKMRINLRSVNNDGTQPVVDGVLAVFSEDFSNEIDKFDAVNKDNIGSENFFIESKGQYLSIERKNSIVSADTINLQFSNVYLRNYQLEFSPSNFDMQNYTAIIEDNFTGTKTTLDLSTESIYDFSVNSNPASYAHNRFRVILKKVPAVVLPVNITEIKASAQKNTSNGEIDKINVEWKVENQVNITGYEVEKSSDGIQFNDLKNVPAVKNNSGTAAYELNDNNPINGVNYYRVKIIERNGSYQYSSVAKVLLNEQKNIRLYQNPVVNNIIQLEITGQSKGNYNFSLFDEYGKKVMTTSLNHNGADGIKNIPVNAHLSKGIYNATVTGAKGYKATLKISIE